MLGGCPYKSGVPIDPAVVKVNPALLGKWESKISTEEKYDVSKADDFTYKIEKRNKDSKEPTIYRAYASDVDGEIFLNLAEEAYPNEYYLYKLDLNSSVSKVTLHGITENIREKFTSSAELKAFIKKYKGLSFFYDKTEDVYIKD